MLWLLMRGYGQRVAEYSGLAGCARSRDQPPAKLDEIRCAGGVKIERMRSSAQSLGFFCAYLALSIIADPNVFKTLLTRPRTNHRTRYTNRKYKEHIECLRSCGICSLCKQEEISFWSTYFAVPKGPDESRAIFNGRLFSNWCLTPRPVNIAAQLEILRRMNLLQGPKHVVVGDLRHWFHQFPLHPLIRRWFGLAVAGMFYVWSTLPMGWSWSPHIAQAGAWMILVWDNPYVSPGALSGEQLPTFIELTDPMTKAIVGFMCVYYDNYLVCTTSGKVAEFFNSRIPKNAIHFGVVIKEHRWWKPHELYQREDKGFVYLGLRIAYTEENKAVWRIDPSKIETLAIIPYIGSSVRLMAECIGKILYADMLMDDFLGNNIGALAAINVLRRVARHAREVSWDATDFIPTDVDRMSLLEGWERLRQNPWREMRETQYNHHTIVIATDASDWGWGYVMYVDGVITEVHSAKWSKEMALLHIFVLETYAACEGIRRARNVDPDARIVIITDNTASAGALRRGYSSNDLAFRYVQGVLGSGFHVVTVVSADNTADNPSRGDRNCPCEMCRAKAKACNERKRTGGFEIRDLCPSRNTRTWLAYEKDLSGQRIGKQVETSKACNPGIRHPEAPNEEDGETVRWTEGISNEWMDVAELEQEYERVTV